MGSIQVYLESGFEHDHVTVRAGGVELEEPDVTTRYQVGLASVIALTVPDGVPLTVKIAVPNRGLTAEVTIDPNSTPHVRVNVAEGSLVMHPEAVPPMFA